MAERERDKLLQIRVTEEEREWLQQLADEDGFTSSDIVRFLIRREHRERFPSAHKPKGKR